MQKELERFDVLDFLNDAEDIKSYFDEYLISLEEDATSGIEFDTDLMMKDVLIEFNAHTMALIFQISRSLPDDSHAEEKNTLDCLFSALNRLRDFLYATAQYHINKDAVISINRTARALITEYIEDELDLKVANESYEEYLEDKETTSIATIAGSNHVTKTLP